MNPLIKFIKAYGFKQNFELFVSIGITGFVVGFAFGYIFKDAYECYRTMFFK